VRTIFGRKRTMHDAASMTSPMLDALVRHAERRTGSRMLAYDTVALRIHATYQANCDRWDAQADEDRAAFFALGRGDNEMDNRANASLHVAPSKTSSGARRAAALVAPVVGEGAQ
jgi:hypothetical protein